MIIIDYVRWCFTHGNFFLWNDWWEIGHFTILLSILTFKISHLTILWKIFNFGEFFLTKQILLLLIWSKIRLKKFWKLSLRLGSLSCGRTIDHLLLFLLNCWSLLILRISQYSLRMQENTEQEKSEYGHFSCVE